MNEQTTSLSTDAVDEVTTLARAVAAETDELRRLPDQLIAAATEAGMFDLVTPTDFGGQGQGLMPLADMTRRLADGCTSAAWTLSFLTMHNWLLSRFPNKTQAEVWAAKPHALVPAPLAPGGQAEMVDGGIRVTGEWAWGTGVMHADWAMVHVMVDLASLDLRMALLPIDDVKVLDVWDTNGMRGTGSNTVAVDDVFVPDHRCVSSLELMDAGAPDPRYPLRGAPVVSVLCLIASTPALGAAERCLDLVTSYLDDRQLAYTLGQKQADKASTHVRLGELTLRVHAVRALWEQTMAELDRAMRSADGVSTAARVHNRMVASHVVRESRSIVNDLVAMSGGSVHFSGNPLPRYQRDLNTMSGHAIFDWDRTMEMVGLHRLGMDLGPTAML